MSQIILKIPRRKRKIQIIRSQDLINKEFEKNMARHTPEPEPEPEPEPIIDFMPEPEPEPEIELASRPTVFTEVFTISDSNQPIEISLKNIPEDSISLDIAVEQVQAAYDRGFDDGMEAARAALETTIAKQHDWIKRIDSVSDELRRHYTKEIHIFQDVLVDLAVMTAEHIISNAVAIDSNEVIAQARKAIAELNEDVVFKIIAHPDDVQILKEVKSTLVEDESVLKGTLISPDTNIQRGGCVLITSAGTIDARLDMQLKKIKTLLNETVKSGALREDFLAGGDTYNFDTEIQNYDDDSSVELKTETGDA